MNVAMAHDSRSLPHEPDRVLSHDHHQRRRGRPFEDYQGHVGYVLGLRTGANPRVSVTRSANAVEVSLTAPN